MLNFRVTGLSALLTSLCAAGIAAGTRAELDTPETRKFPHAHDPEGNPIEPWEPTEGG